MADRLKTYEQTSINIWDFVIDFQVGNLSERQLDIQDAKHINDIIEASEVVINNKADIYKLLNNVEE